MLCVEKTYRTHIYNCLTLPKYWCTELKAVRLEAKRTKLDRRVLFVLHFI